MAKYVLVCGDSNGYLGTPRFFDGYDEAKEAMVDSFIDRMALIDRTDLLMSLLDGENYVMDHGKFILRGKDGFGTICTWRIFHKDID